MNENEQKDILQPAEDLKKPVRRGDPRKSRLLLLAIGGVILLAALVIGVTRLAQSIQTYVELNTDHTIHLTETTLDKVRKIEIKGKTAVTITKRGDVYTVRELNSAVTSQSACEAAFSNAATLLAEGIASENVTDFTDYGLDEPLSTVRITYADSELLLEIGSIAPASQHYYVRLDGGNTVYLMRKLIVEMYSAGVSAYRDISGFAVSAENLSALALESQGETFEMQYHDKIGGRVFSRWQVVQPEAANTDSAKAESAVAALESIALQSFVRTTQDKSGYGLDAPGQTLTLTYADGSTFIMALGDADSAGNRYACFDGGNDVYLVSGSSLEFLEGLSLQSLVNEFANIVTLTGVERLTVEMDGARAEFTIDRTGEDPVYRRDGQIIDADAFKNAFQTVNTVPVNGFASADQTQGAQAVLTLIYGFAGEEEAYTVAYLDSSINNYALDKDGSVSVTVSKDACAQMLDMWRALMQ